MVSLPADKMTLGPYPGPAPIPIPAATPRRDEWGEYVAKLIGLS